MIRMSTIRYCVLATVWVLSVSISANDRPPISYRMASALSPGQLRTLSVKAEHGDEEAAFRLAMYYSSIEKDTKRREYYLLLATKHGSFQSLEALADFYAMPGGVFNFSKAVSLRETLKSKFPGRTDNVAWAEACAYDYHWRTPWIDRKKERMFLDLAKSWRKPAEYKRKASGKSRRGPAYDKATAWQAQGSPLVSKARAKGVGPRISAEWARLAGPN